MVLVSGNVAIGLGNKICFFSSGLLSHSVILEFYGLNAFRLIIFWSVFLRLGE